MGRYGTRGSAWLSARGLAAFAGGAVAAVLVSRLLPPLVAQASGTMRGSAGRDPLAGLEQDHRVILSLLTEMVESPPDAVVRRTQLLLRLKRRLGAHALAEEDIVYPLLHDEAHAEDDTHQLYGEHAEMKMRLAALERMAKDDPRWVAIARELKDLIATHARQEEEVDFPRLRAVLDDRGNARLSGAVSREKALIL